MKTWIKKNKGLLKFFGFYSIFTFIFSAYFIALVIENINGLQIYAQNRLLTDNLVKIGISGIFNLVILGVWVASFITILFKALFPEKSSFKQAFFFDELSFLKDLPEKIKGEIGNE